jgi:hypothetical protein
VCELYTRASLRASLPFICDPSGKGEKLEREMNTRTMECVSVI